MREARSGIGDASVGVRERWRRVERRAERTSIPPYRAGGTRVEMTTYFPTLEQVKAMAGQGNVVPVYREVVADLETPVSAYLKVARGKHSFLLESVEGGERLARYSFIGTEPYRVLRTGDDAALNETPGDPLLQIEDELRRFTPVRVEGLPRFHGGAVGYMAYECARYYEKLPVPDADPQGFPEAIFLFVDTLLVFDHLQHKIKVVSHARLDGDIEASYRQATWKIEELVGAAGAAAVAAAVRHVATRRAASGSSRRTTRAKAFKAKVERAKEYIKKGDTYQIQVSQRFSRETDAHPFEVYRALRTVNPSPYMYYLELGDMHVVGASPEMLIRVEDGVIETHPIAGTRRRGRDAEDEQRMADELQGSEKERAEHIMLVDLARNDLGRVCEPGSVKVTSLMAIERYSHVMHMVSHVVGKLRPRRDDVRRAAGVLPARHRHRRAEDPHDGDHRRAGGRAARRLRRLRRLLRHVGQLRHARWRSGRSG